MAFSTADTSGTPHLLSYPDFLDYREQNESFEHLVCYRNTDFTLTDSLAPIQVAGQIVSWDLFSSLGIGLEMGRSFLPREEEPGTQVVVLGYSLWNSRYGGDKAILGRSVRINETAIHSHRGRPGRLAVSHGSSALLL